MNQIYYQISVNHNKKNIKKHHFFLFGKTYLPFLVIRIWLDLKDLKEGEKI